MYMMFILVIILGFGVIPWSFMVLEAILNTPSDKKDGK